MQTTSTGNTYISQLITTFYVSSLWFLCDKKLQVSAFCRVIKHCQTTIMYRISTDIRQSFFSFQNNPKDLDPSYEMDLDLWDCLGRVKFIL